MPNLTSLKPLLYIVIFYLLAFWLSLSYWAFRDARERSNSVVFHVFATGLSLVLPIFGLFIYMIIRPPLTMAERRALELETQALSEPGGPARELRPCPSCGEPIDSQYVLCPHCKTQFSKLSLLRRGSPPQGARFVDAAHRSVVPARPAGSLSC